MTKLSDEFSPDSLQDLLPIYYKRLFPHLQFYRWMSYGLSEPSVFENREFSFTLQNDIYIRYQSFANQQELEKEICSKCPLKIDIGAVYNLRPKDNRASTAMKPMQRELVFDIDMTDYDDVRTCCKEANVCPKCWKFMAVACKVIDTALREDFGFEHLLWVFSGRRGIHCWVCDYSARHLDGKGRSAVAEYLHILITGGEGSINRVILGDRMHHAIKRAHQMIEPLFEEMFLVDQNLLASEKGMKQLLGMVSDEGIRSDLEKALKPHEGDSKAIWRAYENFFKSLRVSGHNKARRFKYIIEETQLALAYPRIDINVSKGFNHLLKAPFCVHPKTGKVCIPFNPNIAEKFDPTLVPNIMVLLNEVNTFDQKNKGDGEQEQSRIKDYKKTSMFKGTVIFEEFLRKLEHTFKGKAIIASDKKMEF